jgi:hypothetical protein
MAADYKVEAELELKNAKETKKKAREVAREIGKIQRNLQQIARTAGSSVGRVGSSLRGLGGVLRRSNRSSASLVRNLVAVGATYIGIRAVSSAFQGLTATLIRSNQTVEDTTLSIASMYAEIERTSTFREATQAANGLYRQMELLAVSSPGTAANIADAFSMAFGPMRRAGVEMNTLLNFSRDAVAVASALRIDLPQVARDIGMMATGVAGTDVRTFRMLRSMGMITETTEEWNQLALRQPGRIAERMVSIFQRLGQQSAEAFGRTWTGLTSAFQDIMTFFARAYSAPGFRVLQRELSRVNEFLLKYRPGIEKILTGFGGRMARVLTRIARMLAMIFARLNDNLETAGRHIDAAIANFNRIRPIIRTMLIGAIAMKAAATAIGIAFTIAGGLISVLGPMITTLVPLLGGGGGLAAVLGIGGAGAATAAGGAVAAGGATAATGGIAAIIALLAPLAVLQGALSGLAILIPIVTSVFVAIRRHGDEFAEVLSGVGPMLWEIVENFWRALVSLYEAVSPALELFGYIIVSVVVIAIRALVTALLFMSRILRVTTGVLSVLSSVLSPLIVQIRLVFSELFSWIRMLGSAIARLISMIPGATGVSVPSMTATPGTAETAIRQIVRDLRDAMQPTSQPATEGGTGVAPGARPTTNIDMRGARITVRQDFREADPDRVWVQLRDALEREAIQRISSGFAPALSR